MKFNLSDTIYSRLLTQPILLAVFFVNAPITNADIVTFYFEGEITNFDTPLKWTFSEGESFTV